MHPICIQLLSNSGKYSNIAFIFAIIGALYTTILFIFVKYRETRVVKSSNFPLSLIQIIFHAMQSLQLQISTLKQTQTVCIFNVVTTGSIIKLVSLIHLGKTNQLLTVFQSIKRVKRKYFAKANEVAVPGAFIVANTFWYSGWYIIHLVGTTFKFGVFEKKTFAFKILPVVTIFLHWFNNNYTFFGYIVH